MLKYNYKISKLKFDQTWVNLGTCSEDMLLLKSVLYISVSKNTVQKRGNGMLQFYYVAWRGYCCIRLL